MTNLLRRLSLAFLLALLLVGLAGHLLSPACGASYTASESICAIHAGMLHPDAPQPFPGKSVITSGTKQDGVRTLCLSTEIPHPPTN